MDWDMLLKMTLAVAANVLITAGLWTLCKKRRPLSRGLSFGVGLVFGGVCVFANHIGIDYAALILNVRDIAPLSAGLFFDPLSGFIAGLIGGAERFMAGEIWHIGQYTEVACSLSTFLAGVLAAFLHRHVYHGRRPSLTHSFLMGMMMEVFHMYAVLLTNRNDTTFAFYVVQVCAVPMTLFTAIGVAACSLTVMVCSGQKLYFSLKVPEERTPIATVFQRWLLVVTLILFAFNYYMSYAFQTNLVNETISGELAYLASEKKSIYDNTGRIEVLGAHLQEQTGVDDCFVLYETGTGVITATNNNAMLDALSQESDQVGKQITAEDLERISEKLGEEDGSGNAAPVMFSCKLASFLGVEFIVSAVPVNGEYTLLAMRAASAVYENRDAQLYENTLSDILVFSVLYLLITLLVERLVVRHLDRVNASLAKITDGDLDEVVWVRPSSEFSVLSDDINETVDALKGYIAAAEKKIEDELRFAAEIQDSALPKNFDLPTDKVEIYATMTPAKQVGGDFYDFFLIGPDTLYLVIADVSGKGVPASLFMMRAQTSIRNFAHTGMGPAELLENVNNTLCQGNDAEMFVTVWLGILDLKTGLMKCANAGHEYPVLMRAGEDYELLKDKHGLILAAFDTIKEKEYEIQFGIGDRLFVYTDGVPEAVNTKNEQYGTERLTQKLTRLKNGSQQWILQGMLQDIRNFAGQAEQFDDITMLGMTWKG